MLKNKNKLSIDQSVNILCLGSREGVYMNQEYQLETFNLQLFAEDEDIPETGASTDEFYLDENRELIIGGEREEEAVDTEEETEDEEEEVEDSEEETEEQLETPDKVPVKTVNGDEELSLEELKLGYMRQADYTTKTQEVADQRRLIQSALEQLAGKTPETPKTTSPMERYAMIANGAKADVIRELGLDPDPNSENCFDELNIVHNTALTLQINNMLKKADEIVSKERAVATFEARAKETEPNYDKIYEYTKERVNYLPFIERLQVEQNFTNGNVEGMNDFFNKMAKEYYEKNNVPLPGYVNSYFKIEPKATKITKKVPPVLEEPGTGDIPAKKKTRDASKIRDMESGDVSQWLIDNGLV